MSLEKAQLESEKRFLQVRLDSLVAKENDLKAKYEVEIKATKDTLEAIVVEKDKLLTEVKEEIERVKADREDAEARTVVVYQDGFKDTPEYKDLAHHFMTAGGEQLVERIVETHPEWDILFLRYSPDEVSFSIEP
ncbi:hypothetical protein Adt_11719 [Abeliophyllum distichum]|uniref:Uncharacterized protein n=1 Tax=Abeliophyllum distichum TaxID=126358 RepID=A0ABD1UNN5_9LAMI